jgi:hypothetical protein
VTTTNDHNIDAARTCIPTASTIVERGVWRQRSTMRPRR